jgi:hypothetical protein
MDHQVVVAIISTGGGVITALGGMWIATNQLGKRLDDLNGRMNRLEDSFNAFRDVVSSKFSTLDLEVARILDKMK